MWACKPSNGRLGSERLTHGKASRTDNVMGHGILLDCCHAMPCISRACNRDFVAGITLMLWQYGGTIIALVLIVRHLGVDV